MLVNEQLHVDVATVYQTQQLELPIILASNHKFFF